MNDSACLRCKHYIYWEENPDAENGPGHIGYEECGEGCDSNLGTEYGCMNFEESKNDGFR